jgi:hypothetical protein
MIIEEKGDAHTWYQEEIQQHVGLDLLSPNQTQTYLRPLVVHLSAQVFLIQDIQTFSLRNEDKN